MLVQPASSKGANQPPQDPEQNWVNFGNRVSWDPGEAQSYPANKMPGIHWWPNQPSAEPSAPKTQGPWYIDNKFQIDPGYHALTLWDLDNYITSYREIHR